MGSQVRREQLEQEVVLKRDLVSFEKWVFGGKDGRVRGYYKRVKHR